MIYILSALLGISVGMTLYLWVVNYALVKERDMMIDASMKLMEATKKLNEKTELSDK